MKSIKPAIAIVASIAISSAVAGAARAACPDGSKSYSSVNTPFALHGFQGFSVALDGGDFGPDYAVYDDCRTPAGIGIGEATTGEIVDTEVEGVGKYNKPVSKVLGPNGAAFGNGASVYSEEEFVDGGGDGVGDNPETAEIDESANDVVKKRYIPVSNGTALGAGSHVGHDNSTAVGAGAKTDRKNQVVLGTEKEDVTVRSLPGKVDKSTKTVVVHQADGTLASDGGQIYGALESHSGRLDAHAALLSDHGRRIGEVERGVAIAMAMPDLWLSDKERFAIAGNIGGFGDETAIGLGAILRIDQTWSLNTKIGSDTEFNDVGWTIGARAGF